MKKKKISRRVININNTISNRWFGGNWGIAGGNK